MLYRRSLKIINRAIIALAMIEHKKEDDIMLSARRSKTLGLIAIVTIILVATQFMIIFRSSSKASTVNHYLYVFLVQQMDVYDIDNNFALVKSVSLPMLTDVRGVDADPASSSLYIAYGGDGGSHGNGSLLKYNVLTNTVVWSVKYPLVWIALRSHPMAR